MKVGLGGKRVQSYVFIPKALYLKLVKMLNNCAHLFGPVNLRLITS